MKPKTVNKTISLEISEVTFEKMRSLLDKYRNLYGLQTYDDLINFLIQNQAKVED
ncbi:MAG: hypothetical protein QXO84_01235 [Candidatus Aenigmatarchaeota archaeon]